MYEMILLYFAVLCHFSTIFASETTPCVTPNGEEAQCIRLRSCVILKKAYDSEDESLESFLDASACGTKAYMVCCGSFSNFTNAADTQAVVNATEVDEETQRKLNRDNVRQTLLPDARYCGMQHADDYQLEDETEVNVDHFPWVLSVYTYTYIQQPPSLQCRLRGVVSFLNSYSGACGEGRKTILDRSCTGVLINPRYALTHGDCGSDVIVWVVPGRYFEFDVTSCTETAYGDQCTEPAEFRKPEEQIYSPDKKFLLLRLVETLRYSISIRAICLPFSENGRAKIGDTVITSGWANYRDGKKRIVHKVENCDLGKSTSANIICGGTLTNNTRSLVYGDHGGPIMHRHKIGRYNNWYIEGILLLTSVNFNNKTIEGERITPEVVNWILDNIKP